MHRYKRLTFLGLLIVYGNSTHSNTPVTELLDIVRQSNAPALIAQQNSFQSLTEEERETLLKEAKAITTDRSSYIARKSNRRKIELAAGIGAIPVGCGVALYLMTSSVSVTDEDELLLKQIFYISGTTLSLLMAITGLRVALGTIFASDADRYMQALACEQILETWKRAGHA